MWPAYKQHVREFVKGGRAALVNHSLDGGVRLKDPRNRPSGDPNCELFPQGPVIPVPPSTPLYRPVGAYGNNWAVSPDRHAKRKPPNQRVRRPLFPLFRWWLCPESMPKQHQTVLGSTKTRVQKPVSAIPTRWLKTASSLLQFVPVCRSLSWFVLMRLSLKNARESMGSYLGHGFSGHPGRFPGSRWVTANCEQQLMGHMDVIFQGRARQRSFYKHSPNSYDGSSIFDLYSSIRSSEQSMPAASKTIFSVSIFT